MSLKRSSSRDWRFLPDRSKDPSTLLAAQNETLPRTGYFTTSRIKSAQAVVILCSGTEDNAHAVFDNGTPSADASDGAYRFCSWSDAKPEVREKLVEEQLAFSHAEYCRLFRAYSGQAARGTKANEKDKKPPCCSCVDPTPEYLRTVVMHTRRVTAERVVFHYIHHRAPHSKALCHEGMLLLYCQDSNEHRSLSLKSVHEELGVPATYIFDCPYAGRLVTSLNELLKPEDDVVALGTCGECEALPWDRFGLPVDLFTSCLMSPIRAALNFYRIRGATVLSEPLLSMLQSVTGKSQDRSSPLGELVSILQAIADAIAWSSFEPLIFKRLFREDGALAELFRNFLLAQRILHAFDLHATSRPALPPTHAHHLWDVWDYSVELLLVRLAQGPSSVPARPHMFFEEQMAAFWVWLRFHPELSGLGLGSTHALPDAPVELPIVLQGLLHQPSRLEALRLLACFVDLGVGAVHFTLLVGARPYLTKLLQHDDSEKSPEVAPLALLVWTKMLTFDPTGKEGVLNKDSHKNFYNLAQCQALPTYQRAFAFTCLAIACHKRPVVKVSLYRLKVLPLIANILTSSNQSLLLWMAALLCGEVCRGCHEAAVDAIQGPITQVLLDTLRHSAQEVRAACVYALGSILESSVRAEVPDGVPSTTRPATNSVPAAADATSSADLDAVVPLFRRFLGLGTTGHGSISADPASLSSDEPSTVQGNKWLWLSSTMLWNFCSDTNSQWSSQTVSSNKSGNPVMLDWGITNESSMLVRYELICALAPWVRDLSINHAARFAYFDSLPSPPWDIETSPNGVHMDESACSKLVRSAPSCPSLTKLQGPGIEDGASPPFRSESVFFEWTINCLQQPNALSHAVDYDIATSIGTQKYSGAHDAERDTFGVCNDPCPAALSTTRCSPHCVGRTFEASLRRGEGLPSADAQDHRPRTPVTPRHHFSSVGAPHFARTPRQSGGVSSSPRKSL